jgi:hypothetical protein
VFSVGSVPKGYKQKLGGREDYTLSDNWITGDLDFSVPTEFIVSPELL